MSAYFEHKLLELLPSLYRRMDKDGELQRYLKIPAITLDEIKVLIDKFPTLFDVDRCDEKFLPLLGNIVGYQYDPLKNAQLQRRLIKEAIPLYRRKATIPALDRSLSDIGWQGRIQETFRNSLRLNRRSLVGQSRLPGKIYSLGVFRVESDNVTHGIREVIVPHHPAGTKVYFLQWLYSLLSMESCFDTSLKQFVQSVCFGNLNEAFVTNRRRLNDKFHLNLKRKTWCTWVVTNGSALLQNFERAGVCIFRWHKKRPGFHLNTNRLNTFALVNVWNSERKSITSCEIETSHKPKLGPAIRLKAGQLNKTRIGYATRTCHIIFRQKDYISTVTVISGDDDTRQVFIIFYANMNDLSMQAFGLCQAIV